MSDREALERRFVDILAHTSIAGQALGAVARALADAVDQVRPAPRPLSTKRLREIQEAATDNRCDIPGCECFTKDRQLLLGHIRALEADLDVLVGQLRDAQVHETQFEQGRQVGLDEAANLFNTARDRLRNETPPAIDQSVSECAWHLLADVLEQMEALGPLPQPTTLAALREELAAVRKEVRT